MERRIFIKHLAVLGTALLALPKSVLSAVWDKPAFMQTRVDEAYQALGIANPLKSDSIHIKAPDRAENGSIVQVEINSELANTESITLLVEKNPTTLIATYNISPTMVGSIVTRIKMADTSDVIAVVKAGGKYYQNRKNVVVLESGCGD